MARPENPNEIDEYVNPLCTELDEIGSFQSCCIGHFEHEWLDALGQMIAEGRVPITDAPRVDDQTELRHMDSGYIHRSFHVRIGGTSMRMPSYRLKSRYRISAEEHHAFGRKNSGIALETLLKFSREDIPYPSVV